MLERAEQLAGIGSWYWEVGSDKLVWSRELYRIYGLSPDTPLTYDTFLERVHPDDRAHVGATVRRALEQRKPFRYHERIVRPDGDLRLLDSQGDVELDEDGRPIALFGLCRDVTEERRAATVLQEREERFAKIFQAWPVATVLTSLLDGRVLDVNARFLELTGFRREELIGHASRDVGLLSAPGERERILAAINAQGPLREVQVSYQTRGGERRRALASIERIAIGDEDCLLKLFYRS